MNIILQPLLQKTNKGEHKADVYTLFGSSTSIGSSKIDKKRLAKFVMKKSGWNDHVLISSCFEKVGSLWNSIVEEK